MKQLVNHMKNFSPILFLFVVGSVFYFFTIHGFIGNVTSKNINEKLISSTGPFESSHERSPYAVVLSYYENHIFNLPRDLADFGAPDVSYFNGKFYSFFPIGVPLLIYPFYLFGLKYNLSQLLPYASIGLWSILSLILIYLITKKIFKSSISDGVLAALTFGFATTSWSYAATIYQHAVSTSLILLAFYSVWKFKQKGFISWIWGVVIWSCYGIGILVDYPNALIMLPIMCYFLVCSVKIIKDESKFKFSFRIPILITFIFFILIGFGNIYYNYYNYGDFKKVSQNFPRYEKDKYDQLMKKVEKMKKDEKLKVPKVTTAYLTEQNTVNGLFILLISDDKSIFFFSPILILALYGIFINLKHISLEMGVLLACVFINILVYASFGDPWGGWAFGPRYLIPSMAILSIFSCFWIEKSKHIILAKIIYFLLFVYSSGVALLGAVTTNVIPPKVEAIPLKLKYYNYFLNIDVLKKGVSGSFFYNNFVSQYLTAAEYYFMIFGILIVIIYCVLFLDGLYEKMKGKYV